LRILEEFLDRNDARRAAEVMAALRASGFSDCALTGSIALQIQNKTPLRRRLNDLDYVVEDFASIPATLAKDFLVHHVHADAPPGKLLLQLVDEPRGLRIDIFRASNDCLARARIVPDLPHRALSLEDLGERRPVEAKNYSATIIPCDRCQDFGPFQRAAPAQIVNALGYW
jgi:hypothetical protein